MYCNALAEVNIINTRRQDIGDPTRAHNVSNQVMDKGMYKGGDTFPGFFDVKVPE